MNEALFDIYNNIDIPYKILEVKSYKFYFCLQLDYIYFENYFFDSSFSIIIKGNHINMEIPLDTDNYNMKYFYYKLKKLNENFNGKAILCSLNQNEILKISLTKNSLDINFNINLDSELNIKLNLMLEQSYIYDWIRNFQYMFREFKSIEESI